MTPSLVTILFGLNYLQFCWLIGYKKYFSLRQTLFLTFYIIIQAVIGVFFKVPSSIYLFIPFGLCELIFIIYSLKKIVLAALYFILQNTLMVLSWLFTWDLLNIFRNIYPRKINTLTLFVIVFQQLLFVIFILISKKTDSKYKIFESISQLKKKYLEQSIICIILLLSFTLTRQLSLMTFRLTELIYLIILVFAFTGTFCYILYLISIFQQQQQRLSLLSQKSFQEKNRLELANEFKHDYRNILLSLVSYLEQNQVSEALDYVSSIIDYSNPFIETDYFAQIFMIDLPPAQGLLINFFEKCQKNEIPIHFSINQPVSDNNILINQLDFIRCLSILLDNAFEASMTTKDPFIQLTIEVNNESTIFEVQNTFDGAISIEKILKKKYTTKADHQGRGLFIFVRLLNQYRESVYSFKQKNNFFIANFTFTKKR